MTATHFQCRASRRVYCPLHALVPFEQLHAAKQQGATSSKSLSKQPTPNKGGSDIALLTRVCVLLRDGVLAAGTVKWIGNTASHGLVIGLEMVSFLAKELAHNLEREMCRLLTED